MSSLISSHMLVLQIIIALIGSINLLLFVLTENKKFKTVFDLLCLPVYILCLLILFFECIK